MTDYQITLDEHTLKALLDGDATEAMRSMHKRLLETMLEAEMDTHLGATKSERTDERRGYRNGHYERGLTTRIGQLTLRVPRDRDGTFCTQLFESYSRCERALVCALVEMVVSGVSTRRVRKITEKLCGRELPRSVVSRHASQLDDHVKAWRERPLESDYPFVLVDAVWLKVREDGLVVSKPLMIAVGVREDGVREILGCQIHDSENRRGWSEFLGSLKERGLSGVELVVSDAHEGLVGAIRRGFAGAVWQRCQTHFRRNITEAAPRRHRDALHEGLDAILKASDKQQAREALDELLEELEGKCDKALESLEAGWEDACAVLSWPAKYRKRLRTTNMVERLNRELRRRDKVVGIYPNENSALRLMGARLVEQHEEWVTARKYLDMDEYYAWRAKRREEREAESDTEAAAE